MTYLIRFDKIQWFSVKYGSNVQKLLSGIGMVPYHAPLSQKGDPTRAIGSHEWGRGQRGCGGRKGKQGMNSYKDTMKCYRCSSEAKILLMLGLDEYLACFHSE